MDNALTALDEIRKINAAFPETDPIKAWKRQGKRVAGWSCIYVPEEIIHAAGILPIRVTGGDTEEFDINEATGLSYITLCTYTRSILQLMMNKQFDFLDGYVGTSLCHCVSRMVDVMEYFFPIPIIHVLNVPRNITEDAYKFYREELHNLGRRLEYLYDIQISDQALRESIGVFNQTRTLLRRLLELRKPDVPLISGAEFLEVLNASGRMPREDYNQLLERLLEELETRKWIPQEPRKVRLMLSGSILNNPGFIRSIENLGASVVVDEICSGVRYFEDPVNTSAYSDPWEAIARSYLNKFACSRMIPCERRIDQVVRLAREFRIEGLISRMVRYCTNLDYDEPWLKDRLREEGISMLELSTEYGTPVTAQIRTRIEAFLEMLLDKKGELVG